MKNWSAIKKTIFWIVIILAILLFLHEMKWLGNTDTIFGSRRQFRVGGNVGGVTGISAGPSTTNSGSVAPASVASPIVTARTLTPRYNTMTCQSVLDRTFDIIQRVRAGENAGAYRAEMTNLASEHARLCGTVPSTNLVARSNAGYSLCKQACLNKGKDYSWCGDFCNVWL